MNKKIKNTTKAVYSVLTIIVFLSFLEIRSGFSATVSVNSISSLQNAINNAKPGDNIIMANGNYTAVENIIIQQQGTASKPITIAAETIGGVKIEGAGGFIINSPALYIIVKGFNFVHKTGIASIKPGATHCTFTRNAFECAPVNAGTKAYLTVSGDDNEVSYNTFQNKTDEGQMLSVQGPGGDKMAKRTWIHHNYFYNFPPNEHNNCSAIQIGLSGRSMDSAFCIVEYNLFIKTAGENEGCICHKACKNIIRYNTFGEGSEELSLRHGNKSEVYGNFFMGSTGLRFSGDDHLIYNNFFKNCRDAIVCTNGDGEVLEGSKLTCHDRADRVKIVYNTMVNCSNNFRQPQRNNGLGATNITFANNIIEGGKPVSVEGIYLNPVWEGNIIWNTSGGSMPSGSFTVEDPKLKEDSYGVGHLSKNSSAIKAGIGVYTNGTIDIDGQKSNTKLNNKSDGKTKGSIIKKPVGVNDVGPKALIFEKI